MAYLTVFPVQGGMRANLFVYWSMEDTRLRSFRHQPKGALSNLSQRLRSLPDLSPSMGK